MWKNVKFEDKWFKISETLFYSIYLLFDDDDDAGDADVLPRATRLMPLTIAERFTSSIKNI